jgi:predicted DsbA family dithiol-disulfide isomerase
MNVDIWSDIACPWCYIGKRRFEAALGHFAHAEDIAVRWHSYQLAPDAPATSDERMNDVLAQKYGLTAEQAAETNTRMEDLAAVEGLEFHLGSTLHGNTFDAHRLVHLAGDRGLQDAMKERLFRAHFTENLPIGDRETLVCLAAEVGLSAPEVRDALADGAYGNEVERDIDQAHALGIRGVPFFVIDERYGVSGAQSAQVLLGALEHAWSESQPIETLAVDADAACEGDACVLPPQGTATGAEQRARG